MRFLRLDARDELRSLHLHPLVSVVSTFEAGEQEDLLEAIRRISTGSTAGLRGLVECGGLLVELDPRAGEALNDTSTSATVVVHVDRVERGDREAGLCREIDRWESQAAIDAATVEEIRSHIDLSVAARVWSLRARLEPAPPTSAPAPTAGGLRAQAVRLALDAVRRLDRMVAESAPEIEALLARWERYSERRAEHEPHLVELAANVAEAERAVTAATDGLAEAREAARPAMLAPEDEARLEELFLLSTESSLWRKGLSSDETAELQALVNSVGAASYTEYSMRRMSPAIPEDQEPAVTHAEDRLEEARRHLERTRTERAEDEVAAELRAELSSIKRDCQPFLGVLVPADIGAALRRQRRLVESPEWLEAYNRLRDVLASNDLQPDAGSDPEEIFGWTDSWLRAEESAHDLNRPTPAPAEAGQAEAIGAELATESLTLVRHRRALSRIERAEREAARSEQRLERLRDQLRDRIDDPPPSTAAQVMAIVAPVAEQVIGDIGASVPVAIVGDLPALPPGEVDSLMEALEEMAQKVQVVVVSGNPAMGEWVDRVGLQRADHQGGLGAAV